MTLSALRPSSPLAVALAFPLLLGAGIASRAEEQADAAASAAASAPRSGEAIYAAACASCHGVDGRGAPRTFVGFDTPLPDFSDCGFSTREPDADWGTVAAEGGPVRVFDRMMPAFGGALSAAEIQRALDHVRSFCDERGRWPRGELNLPRPLLTSKAFPEDEAVLTTTVNLEGRGAVMSKLIYERRLGARGQVELILPFGFLEDDYRDWTGGLGDVVVATKWALIHSLRAGSILSLALEAILPTGDAARGLGKGATILEPFLAYGQLLPAEGFLHVQGGAELSTEPEAVEHELFWRAALGMSLAWSNGGRVWSPMVEVAGARELAGGASIYWDLVPQLQVTLSTRQHVMAAAGVRVPVNDAAARTTVMLTSLLWDWFDGSILEGW
jgi:hypothetical protein